MAHQQQQQQQQRPSYVWLTPFYTVEPVTTDTSLVVDTDDLYDAMTSTPTRLDGVYLCPTHGVSTQPSGDDDCCRLFRHYDKHMLLRTRYQLFAMPPGTLFSNKNLNYMQSFLRTVREPASTQEMHQQCYMNLMASNFRNGQLNNMQSGKNSLVRNRVLGFPAPALRLTMVIDMTLGPSEVAIPRRLYDECAGSGELMIVNRAPSINTGCVYALRAMAHNDPKDSTIHMNSICIDRLHADQDGDTLTLWTYGNGGGAVSRRQRLAHDELMRLTWQWGERRDLTGRTRFVLSQQHRLVAYHHDRRLRELSPLWRDVYLINGGDASSFSKRCDDVMALGASTHRNECDDFLRHLQTLVAEGVPLPTISDLFNGTGVLHESVLSTAKGTEAHLERMRSVLRRPRDPHAFMEAAKNNYDNYVDASTTMSREGTKTFTMLFGANSVMLDDNVVSLNETQLMSRFTGNALTAGILYDAAAVKLATYMTLC